MYKIVRMYRDHTEKNRTIKTKLSLEDAQAHCKDPETSSSTVPYPNVSRKLNGLALGLMATRKLNHNAGRLSSLEPLSLDAIKQSKTSTAPRCLSDSRLPVCAGLAFVPYAAKHKDL